MSWLCAVATSPTGFQSRLLSWPLRGRSGLRALSPCLGAAQAAGTGGTGPARGSAWDVGPGCWVGPGRAHPAVPEGPHCHVCRQVAAEYELVHRTMAQPPVREYVPFAWTTLVHVKAESFRALAHYHVAVALCGGPRECPAPRATSLRRPWPGLTAFSHRSSRAGAPGFPAGLPRAPGRVTAAGAGGAPEAG